MLVSLSLLLCVSKDLCFVFFLGLQRLLSEPSVISTSNKKHKGTFPKAE